MEARAQQRWRWALIISTTATAIAVALVLCGAIVTADAAGADTLALIVLAVIALVVVGLLLGIVLGVSWWVLHRRGALGPSLLWGVDRATRRRVVAGLRRGEPMTGEDHELATSEADRVVRFGLLLPGVLFANVAIQAGWIAADRSEVDDNPLLFGARLVAIVFFGWGGVHASVALRRARRYLGGAGRGGADRDGADRGGVSRRPEGVRRTRWSRSRPG
ncbi:hypothetical protein [Cryptosporangium aurantiacum]|uniref:hypothetical protein n=1 Tax=Cryptosporangium aurantiacum TaxID=134849 RepID=UPI00093549BB|nr:hypothetical protein [Cryptosporangium aurantiacum]